MNKAVNVQRSIFNVQMKKEQKEKQKYLLKSLLQPERSPSAALRINCKERFIRAQLLVTKKA